MNNTEYLSKLDEALDAFDCHPDLIGELFDLLGKSGNESRFLEVFTKRLVFLRDNGVNAIQHSKNFERLNERIYSMHVDLPTKNIRVLYSFMQNGTILLLAFHERGGKRATNYTNMIPEATHRLEELED